MTPIRFRRSLIPRVASLLLSLIPTLGLAGVEESTAPVKAAEKTSIFSGDFNLSFLNQYNTRGIIVEDEGLIIQPSGNLYAKVYEGQGFINSFSFQAGFWADISTEGRLGRTSPHSFTELDWDLGILVNFGKRFTFSSVFVEYDSPSDAYSKGRFINNVLSFNEAGLISDNFSIQPHFTFLYELNAPGQAGLRPDAWYFEPGIAPNYTFFRDTATPLTVSLPITFGLGNKFYGGETFGYYSVGPQFSIPLSFVPDQYGKWSYSLGYKYYHLGDTTAAIAPGADADQHLFSTSISVKF